MREINAYVEIGGITFTECLEVNEEATEEEINVILLDWAEEIIMNEASYGYDEEEEED